MIISPIRLALLATLLVPLAACSSGPEQPRDTVDDRSTEAPFADEGAPSPDFAELGVPAAGDAATGAVRASAFAAIEGRWATDAANCETDADLVISATTFESADRTCRVAGTIDGGDGSVTATLSCSATGAEDNADAELVKLTPTGDTLTLSFVGSDAPMQTLSRCP